MEITIFHEPDGDLSVLQDKTITVLGFGNQAKAQALNMKDSGLRVIIGVSREKYKIRAEKDGFETYSIDEAIKKGDFIFLLLPGEEIKDIFNTIVIPNINEEKTLVFSSGYYLTFNIIKVPKDIDILLISPRGIGEMIRRLYLNEEGFFSFISIYQDTSGFARENLLGLTKAVGGLSRAGIELSMKEQSVLNLFVEQAFIPAFTLVLMRAIRNLINAGYTPEAIFIELILSEEMIFTVDKMIEVGLVRQMNFHSQTSQYGSLSRGIKFSKVGNDLNQIQESILEKIAEGDFAKKWENVKETSKLDIMKKFAYNSDFWDLEKKVYENLDFSIHTALEEITIPPKEQIEKNEELSQAFDNYKTFFEGI
jgi:ketol-acid reductoisomerase